MDGSICLCTFCWFKQDIRPNVRDAVLLRSCVVMALRYCPEARSKARAGGLGEFWSLAFEGLGFLRIFKVHSFQAPRERWG